MSTIFSRYSYSILTSTLHTLSLMNVTDSPREEGDLRFRIVTKPEEAAVLWERFSPHKSLDDEWDFRYTFFKYLSFELYFIVGEVDEHPQFLLPLQKNTLKGLMPPYYPGDNKEFLEFFGGDDTDDNRIMGISDARVFDFLKTQSLPARLAPLASSSETSDKEGFYEDKYILDFIDYKTYEDFLQNKWSSQSRKKIRQQLRKLYREHSIEILVNNYEDIDLIVKYNIQRFGEASSFRFEYRKEIFRDLIELYDVLTLTVVVDGKKEAVSYGIIYKNTYIGMNAGVNSAIPDLSKLLILAQIDHAIARGCKTYDAGKGDSGWKEQFHLKKIPQYMLNISK